MKEIIISTKRYGIKTVKLDDKDYEGLKKYSWRVVKDGNMFYCFRNTSRTGGRRKKLFMHREILGIKDSKISIDRQDRNGLNNQRNNIRIATTSENQSNKLSKKGSSSKYKGVCCM